MITLRHLSSGIAYVDLALGFCVARNTISKVVREVSNSIVVTYIDQYLDCPSTPEEWEKVVEGFWTK